MKLKNELEYTQLKRFFTIEQLKKYKEEIKLNKNDKILIGQKRVDKSLELALNTKKDGYNVYLNGVSGIGKTSFAIFHANRVAVNEKIPMDICYIYNFADPKKPRAIYLKAGLGAVLKNDLEQFMVLICDIIPKLFLEIELEEKKIAIIKKYQAKKDEVIKTITIYAKQFDFGVKMTNTGIYFMPVINNEMINEEQFENLDEITKDLIGEKSSVIQEKASEVMISIREFEAKTALEIEVIEYNHFREAISKHISNLLVKYELEEEVFKYLLEIKEDIINNISDFNEEENEDDEALQNIVPWANKRSKDDYLSKYKVNLFVDNRKLTHAPVINCSQINYNELFGDVEFDSEFGNVLTDFLKIKSGKIHLANGGYLILQVQDVLTNISIWENLKKALKNKEAKIESSREFNTGVVVSNIHPQPTELDFKLILVGSDNYFDLLKEFDDEFYKYFKINAQFDMEMDFDKNIVDFLVIVLDYINKNENFVFYDCAICEIVEIAIRLSENKGKLCAKISHIFDLIDEACTWAKLDNRYEIDDLFIKETIKEMEFRNNIYKEKIDDMIEQQLIMIQTDGEEIGQVNGLAVIDLEEFTFANATKITATSYIGKAGIINVEKESRLSGAIHDKGIQVITGFLGQTFSQDFPLSLSTRVCFEQNYNGIDGDSASSTELYAILSSISGISIRQDIAVTGSVNQKGEIQAIGGVTYKIEGFYNLCKSRGLTGVQGVIIPFSNVEDLTLNDEVIEAVKNNMFHIYPIKLISEGLEILTGVEVGEKNEKGKYINNSIYGRVYSKLKEYYKKSLDN